MSTTPPSDLPAPPPATATDTTTATDTLGPFPPPESCVSLDEDGGASPDDAALAAARAVALEGTKMVLELPSATLAAGKRTTLAFNLAYPSFVRGLRWVPGFKLERLVVAGKDFGDGTERVDGRLYHEHRVLKGDRLSLQVLNTSKEDRNFRGSMTIEISGVIDDDDYACSPTEPSGVASTVGSPTGVVDVVAAAATEERGLSCVPST
jgi:hypothetical protein